MSVTAIFKMGFLEGKRKIPYPVPEYLIPLHERTLSVVGIGSGEVTMKELENKILVFEYVKQVGKRTFEYRFKKIE